MQNKITPNYSDFMSVVEKKKSLSKGNLAREGFPRLTVPVWFIILGSLRQEFQSVTPQPQPRAEIKKESMLVCWLTRFDLSTHTLTQSRRPCLGNCAVHSGLGLPTLIYLRQSPTGVLTGQPNTSSPSQRLLPRLAIKANRHTNQVRVCP